MGNLININDLNYKDFCAGGVAAAGRKFGYTGRRYKYGTYYAPLDVKLIPRAEWKDRITAQLAAKKDLKSLADATGQKCKDQNGLSYCWAYGSVNAEELHRAIEGQSYLELSPESVGGPATGWVNEGGYAEQAANQLEDFGACQESYMDRPNSLSPNKWKTGWQKDALNQRLEHSWSDVPADFNTVVSILLADQARPIAAGLDWWGHLVCYYGATILPNGSIGILFRNSWGADWGDNGFGTLTESKAIPDGAFVPIVGIAPDPIPTPEPIPVPIPVPDPIIPPTPTPWWPCRRVSRAILAAVRELEKD